MSESNNVVPAHLEPHGDFALSKDWPYSSTSQERLQKLYKTGGGTFDFVIGLVPPFTSLDERVYLHKAIVAAASPVLKELIAKAHKAREWNFNMHDASEKYGVVDAKQFKNMIEFIYTDKVNELESQIPPEQRDKIDQRNQHVERLVALGKTFKVPSLEAYCSSKMKDATEALTVKRRVEASVEIEEESANNSFEIVPDLENDKRDTAEIGSTKDVKENKQEEKSTGSTSKNGKNIGIGNGNNPLKASIMREVMVELKDKLVAELKKDLLVEIKEKINNSDLHGIVMNEVENKIRNSFNL